MKPWNNVPHMRMKRIRVGARAAAIALAMVCVAPASAQLFDFASRISVQVPYKGIPGQPPGQDRRYEKHGSPDQHRQPPLQQPDRRGQMTDDERRSLNQDLDKANRELYRRRSQ